MNRRQCSAVAVLATLAFSISGGYTYAAAEHQAWQDREDQAGTAITANQTALNSAIATGQDPQILLAQCRYWTGAYNTAAQHLGDSPLNPSTECQP